MRTLLMTAVLLSACVSPAGAGSSSSVEGLKWMAGGWGAEGDGGWVEEHWLTPRGGLMLGANRSGDKAAAKAFEHLRISAGTDGVPIYWAAPQGGAATPFRQIAAGPGWVTFENKANAYPTRISYRRTGDMLNATIEGPNGDRRQSWTWRRLARPR